MVPSIVGLAGDRQGKDAGRVRSRVSTLQEAIEPIEQGSQPGFELLIVIVRSGLTHDPGPVSQAASLLERFPQSSVLAKLLANVFQPALRAPG